jgi:hypothetical protein
MTRSNTSITVFRYLLPLVSAGGIFFPLSAPALDFTLDSNDPVLLWNQATLEAIKNSTIGPTPSSRALGMVHTSIFDAWSAFDPNAIGTQASTKYQVSDDFNNEANQKKAISYAAYTTLVDLFPTQKAIFDDLMLQQGYDPLDRSTDKNTAAGVGNFAALELLNFRHQDGSNQLNGYIDTTGYQPVNTWDNINDPNRWQPLSPDGGVTIQKFLTPQWGEVTPFALDSGSEFLPNAPALFGTQEYIDRAVEVIKFNANLTDKQKSIVEYWAGGPGTELPPGIWNRIGEYVSVRDGLSLDENVKLFFALGNSLMDAGVAAWDAKVEYDSIRPISSIRYLASQNLLPEDGTYVRTSSLTGQQEIFGWMGVGEGSQWVDGTKWIPYQKSTFITPPFAEHVSGHSTYSAAAAEILQRFTGSDVFGGCATIPAGSSQIEGSTPATEIELCWDSFTDAAEEAGMSRLYGGIHFASGNTDGQVLGRKVGGKVWNTAQFYINGGKTNAVPEPTSWLAFSFVAWLGEKLRRSR